MATKKQDIVDIGSSLLEARKEKGLPKTKAATEMGVSRLTYDMWERNSWVPDVERAQQIATFTGLSKVDILTALLRANGIIDHDAYLDLKRGRG